MKKALIYLLLILVISFLNPDYVWRLLIRMFPSAWYEYGCLTLVAAAWFVSLGIVVAVVRRAFSRRSVVHIGMAGFLLGLCFAHTSRFCGAVNRHFTVAFLHGNLHTAELLLHLGADINAPDAETGQTPLQRVQSIRFAPETAAVFEPHRENLATWLVAHGALAAQDEQERTPPMPLIGTE